MVNLFDELLIMAEGRLVYQGPVAEVGPYFARLGYPCPRKKAMADFLIDVRAMTDRLTCLAGTAIHTRTHATYVHTYECTQIHCPHAREEFLELLAARQRRKRLRQPQQGDNGDHHHSPEGSGGPGRPESSLEFMVRYYDEAGNPLWAEKKELLLAAPAPGTHAWKATEGARRVVDGLVSRGLGFGLLCMAHIYV